MTKREWGWVAFWLGAVAIGMILLGVPPLQVLLYMAMGVTMGYSGLVNHRSQQGASQARPQKPPVKANIKGLTANPTNRLSKGKSTRANAPKSRPQVRGSYDPDLARQRQLRAQLDSLTRDPEASNRLVDQIYARNRHQTRAWCLEKAILDIERDRR